MMKDRHWELDCLNADRKLVLLATASLSPRYELNEECKVKLHQALSLLQQALGQTFHQQTTATLARALEILEAEEDLHSPKTSPVGIPLAQWEIEDYDNYFQVKHIQTSRPVECLLQSLIVAYQTFLAVELSDGGMNAIEPLLIWKRCHWIFFVFVQGLIVCLLRFKKNIESGSTVSAGIELETTAEIMLGGGVAMNLAAILSKQAYVGEVRPTMVQPRVRSEDFSGMMACDHAYLVTLWKQNKTHFKTLPSSLQPQYEKMLSAYEFMALSHTAICDRFGGGEAASLRGKKNVALETLSKITRARRQLIDPNGRSAGGCLHNKHEYEKLMKIGVNNYADLLCRVANLSNR
jgi:hypothetical protein